MCWCHVCVCMSVCVYCVPLFPSFIGVISPVGCGGSDTTPPGDMDTKPQHTEVTLSLGGVTHTIYLHAVCCKTARYRVEVPQTHHVAGASTKTNNSGHRPADTPLKYRVRRQLPYLPEAVTAPILAAFYQGCGASYTLNIYKSHGRQAMPTWAASRIVLIL